MANTFVRVVHSTCPTSTGTEDFTVTGLGSSSDIKLAKVEVCYATAEDTDTDGLSGCSGMTDGTTEVVAAWSSEHNVGTTDTYTYTAQDAVVALMDPADGYACLVEAVFDSWITDGVRLDFTTVDAAYRIIVTLIAGPDVETDVQVVDPSDSVSGTVTVTPGYTASTNLILGLGGQQGSAFDGTLQNGAYITVGAWSNDGSTLDGGSMSWFSVQAVGTTDPQHLYYDSRLLSFMAGGSNLASFTATSFNASTGAFTLTTQSVAFPSAGRIALALIHLPSNVEARCWGHATPTSTGTTSDTTPGWQPQFVYHCTSANNSVNAIKGSAQGGVFGFGHADEEGNEAAMSWAEQNGQSTSNNQSRFTIQAIRTPLHQGGSNGHSAVVDSWDASGVTLDYDIVVGSSARYGFAWAIQKEDEVVAVVDESASASDGAVGAEVDPVSEVVDESASAADEAVSSEQAALVEVVDESATAADDTVSAEEATLTGVVDESATASDGTVRSEQAALAEVADESATAADVAVGSEQAAVTVVADESASAADTVASMTTVSAVVDESATAADVVVSDVGELTQVAQVVNETATATDVNKRRLIRQRPSLPDRSVATSGSGVVSWNQHFMPTPQGVVDPPGSSGEVTVVKVINESAAAADTVANETTNVTIEVQVVDESLTAADTAANETFGIEVQVVDESATAADGQANAFEDPPNDEYMPPDVGYGPEYFEEPMVTRLSILNTEFNDIDMRDTVVEMSSYDEDTFSEEWSFSGKPLNWKLFANKHKRAHIKAKVYPQSQTNSPDPGGHGPFCVKLQWDCSPDGWGAFERIDFWDVHFYNEGDNNVGGELLEPVSAKFLGGLLPYEPGDIAPDEDFFNTSRRPIDPGVICFHRTVHRSYPGGPTEVNFNPIFGWSGYGVKMHMHPQGYHSLLFDGCQFVTRAQEHAIYSEWIQRLDVRNCYFEPTGGNAIQLTGRTGNDTSTSYFNGNRLMPPLGWDDGFVYIKDTIIKADITWTRDAHEVSIFGFLGDIVIDNLDIRECVGAIAVDPDLFKGHWLANGTSVPWDQPILWRKDVEGPVTPPGLYSTKSVWIDNLTCTYDPDDPSDKNKEQLLFGGCKEVHVNRFSLDAGDYGKKVMSFNIFGKYPRCAPKPGYPEDAEDPDYLPNVTFYDAASVLAHEGLIGKWVPDSSQTNKFQAFTYEELSVLTQGGLP